MDMGILYGIQSIRAPWLDSVMQAVFDSFVGSKGEIWLILGMVLLVFPKTRRAGLTVLASYIIAYYIGDGILKNLIARPRPCEVDQAVQLLVKRPTSFSCPSVHSMLAFASAVPVFLRYRRAGIAVLVFAALVGFSRMYFFVHYPSDVLFGAVLGAGIGSLIFLADRHSKA